MRPEVRSDDTQKKGLAISSMRPSPKFSRNRVRHLAAAHQRDQRERVVGQRIVVDEGRAHARRQFFDAPFEREAGRDDGAHARAAQLIDRHMRFHQRLDDADMGEAARAAAGQHKTDRAAGDEPRQPLDVVGLTRADMVMRLEDAAAQREMIGQPLAAALRMQAAEAAACPSRVP
jgi:hypothetical protein